MYGGGETDGTNGNRRGIEDNRNRNPSEGPHRWHRDIDSTPVVCLPSASTVLLV